jgi:hypothetical protein
VNLAAAREALAAAAAPPAAAPLGSVPMPATPAPAAPAVPPLAGRWTRYAAKLGSALLVTASASSIRKGGHEPREPDGEDVERFSEALDEGLALQFGTAAAPWWLGCALAAGGVYAGMRVGAAKLPAKESTPPPVIVPDLQPVNPPTSPLVASVFPPPIGAR